MSFSVVMAWTSDFQELDLGPGRIIKMWHEVGSWIFLFLNLWTLVLALRKDNDWASTATSAVTGNSETWVFARSSVQTLATLHPKWKTSCASWLPSIHLDLLTTFLELFHQPSYLVPGILPMVIPATLLLKKTTMPVNHCDSRHPANLNHHHVAFTSTPVLFYPDSTQPFVVKSNSSSQIAEAVLSQLRLSLFHECAFVSSVKAFRDT